MQNQSQDPSGWQSRVAAGWTWELLKTQVLFTPPTTAEWWYDSDDTIFVENVDGSEEKIHIFVDVEAFGIERPRVEVIDRPRTEAEACARLVDIFACEPTIEACKQAIRHAERVRVDEYDSDKDALGEPYGHYEQEYVVIGGRRYIERNLWGRVPSAPFGAVRKTIYHKEQARSLLAEYFGRGMAR